MYTHMHVYRRYLRKILLHVPQTPIINRASRSHATKVRKKWFQNGTPFYMIWGAFWGAKVA